MNNTQRKNSLYTVVSSLIILAVLLFFIASSIYFYSTKKSELIESIHKHSGITIVSLQKNLAHFIEAYAVNDYNILVKNEVKDPNFLSIFVEDYNMAEITGKSNYVTVVVNKETKPIMTYETDLPEEILEQCFYIESGDIFSTNGKLIGRVSICTTDSYANKLLQELIGQNILIGLVFVSFLLFLLYIIIKKYTLEPIIRLKTSLNMLDKDGLPKKIQLDSFTIEFEKLYLTLNKMIDSVHSFKVKERELISQLDDEKNRFNLAMEGTQDGLWDWNPLTNEVFFSTQWKRMLGYEDYEISENLSEWSKRVHPEDIESTMADVKKHLEGKTDVYENKHRMRCKDGSWKWILDRGKALFDEKGNAIRFVGFHTDISDTMEHQEALEHSAKHDLLTQLPNRFLFNELIQVLLHQANRNLIEIAVIYIDLDGFKGVNDTYGHSAGDEVLIEIANRVQTLLREEDIFARLGGDEFVVVINDIKKQRENLIPLLQRLLNAVRIPILIGGNINKQVQLSASIGVSTYPQDEEVGPEALLRQADQAMYEAKNSGKNRYNFFDYEANQTLKAYKKNASSFSKAIFENELVMYYQPKVNMKEGKIIGFEALLRWQHPQKGLLFPDEFLPKVQTNQEIMLDLGHWVFNTVFKQITKWKTSGYNFSVSINISAHEFKSKHLLDTVNTLFKKYPLVKAEDIELEILETHALEDSLMAHSLIKECQELGLSIALDDFGTGYSTMEYLKNLPVNTLKIDKSFVIEMVYDSGSLSIIEAAIGLANAFRCNIIAEGVESENHGELLIELGCLIAQGYAISKPMPADEVLSWSKKWQAPVVWQNSNTLQLSSLPAVMAIVDHRKWMQMIDLHVDDSDNPLPILNPKECRFGKWLNNDAKKLISDEKIFNMIKKLHDDIHNSAHEYLNTRDHCKLEDISSNHDAMIKLIVESLQ